MSPASSGALEVERYIGACLISSQARFKGGGTAKIREQFFQRDNYLPHYLSNNKHHHQQQNHLQRCRSVDGWAGGVPLISFANYQQRHNKPPQEVRVQDNNNGPNPLSRLAVHTHGAPLVLTSRYNNRKNKACLKNNAQIKGVDHHGKSKDIRGADTISVNSDESSASTNSENSLPRIIKPRKRRKKDRKPPHFARPLGGGDDCFSTDSGSPDINSSLGVITIDQYLPFTFEQFNNNNVDFYKGNANDNNYVPVNKITIIKSDFLEDPKLHHSFEDVKELPKDINDNQPASLCQCRYCDPSGHIWDVDRYCYSPFLTTPDRENVFTVPEIQLDPFVGDYGASDIIECMTNLSLDKNCASFSRNLEVSTEIVTSLNGHRDLEIKFFSASPAPQRVKKSPARTFSLEEFDSKSDTEVNLIV